MYRSLARVSAALDVSGAGIQRFRYDLKDIIRRILIPFSGEYRNYLPREDFYLDFGL